jgi:hypothetical protein
MYVRSSQAMPSFNVKKEIHVFHLSLDFIRQYEALSSARMLP